MYNKCHEQPLRAMQTDKLVDSVYQMNLVGAKRPLKTGRRGNLFKYLGRNPEDGPKPDPLGTAEAQDTQVTDADRQAAQERAREQARRRKAAQDRTRNRIPLRNLSREAAERKKHAAAARMAALKEARNNADRRRVQPMNQKEVREAERRSRKPMQTIRPGGPDL